MYVSFDHQDERRISTHRWLLHVVLVGLLLGWTACRLSVDMRRISRPWQSRACWVMLAVSSPVMEFDFDRRWSLIFSAFIVRLKVQYSKMSSWWMNYYFTIAEEWEELKLSYFNTVKMLTIMHLICDWNNLCN